MDELTNPMLGQNGFLAIMSAYGALQGYVLAGVFWWRGSGDRQANRWLSALLLAVTLHMTEIFLYVTGLMEFVPWAAGIGYPLIFLVGPTYLAYTRRLVDPTFRIRGRDLLHALPALLVLLNALPWMLTPAEAKIPFFRAIAQGVDIPVGVRTFVQLLFNIAQNLVYLVITWRLVRRREAEARLRLSDNAVVAGLASLRAVTLSFAAYVVLHMGLYVALWTWGNRSGALVDTVWLFVISVFLQINGYAAITRPENFSQALAPDPEPEVAPESEPLRPKPEIAREPATSASASASAAAEETATPSPATNGDAKYDRAGLDPADADLIRERLLGFMEGAPYRDGSLTLRAVAEQVGASPHHLSIVVNRDLGRNFFDFVNSYRVEECKRMLADPENKRTILEIAYESGFNNKTSFNESFRKHTGLTPSSYRKDARKA